MKDYLLLFRGGLDFEKASPEQLQTSMMEWKKWMDNLGAQGKIAGGERLNPKPAAVMQGGKQASDGPFAEGKELVGGYIIIKAGAIEEAMELAADCPIFIYGGSIELREISKM